MSISDWSSDVCSSDLRSAPEDGLAGAGLADDADRLTGGDAQRDTVHGSDRPAWREESRAEVVDLEHGSTLGAHLVRITHSLALLVSHFFWAFSPRRLKAKTVRNRNTPGTSTMCG